MQKAIIIFNKSAGSGNNSIREVEKTLEKEGYSSTVCERNDEQFPKILEQEWDLLVVAGGDGTVKRSALKVLDKNFPIAVWPVGTSNNIAHAFGVTKESFNLKEENLKSFQLGRLQASSKRFQFFESAGIGLISRMMEEMEKKKKEMGKQEKLQEPLQVLQKMLEEQKEYEVQLQLDNEVVKGKFLGVEILNTPQIGPRLFLAPDVKPDDGFFDVVLIQKEQSKEIKEYLSARLEGKDLTLDLPSYKVESVKIIGSGLPIHSDDDLFFSEEEQEIEISFEENRVKIFSGT